MKITMYIVFILFPINIVSNHFFLIYLNLSYIGAALHVSLISFLFLLSYIIYLTYFSPALKSFWPGLTKEAFHGWSEFLKLGKTYNNDKNKELTVFLKKVFRHAECFHRLGVWSMCSFDRCARSNKFGCTVGCSHNQYVIIDDPCVNRCPKETNPFF